MNTHKEEPKDKYIEAREKVLGILIDEYKQNCNYDALMRIMSVVEEYGGTLEPKEECDTSCGINADPADGFGKCTCGAELAEPTPPSQIEEESYIELPNLPYYQIITTDHKGKEWRSRFYTTADTLPIKLITLNKKG
jgi:hypothetical protein